MQLQIKIWAQLLFIILFSTLLASCGGQNTPAAQVTPPHPYPQPSATTFPTSVPTDLVGTRWTLQSLNGHQLLADTTVTFQFNTETLNGSAGCNFYGAKYTFLPKNGITVGEVEHTLIGCIAEGVEEQEREYENTFSYIISYKVEDKTLSLRDEQGKALLQYQLLPKFKGDPSYLIGKTWQLVSVSGTGFEGVALKAFTLRFDTESNFSGTTICRDYEGEYGVINDSFGVGSDAMTTDNYCSIEKDLIAEGTYMTLLSNVWQYNVSQTQLELYTIRGEKLVFELVSQK